MAPVVTPKADPTPRPRLLVVDDEPELVELIRDMVGRNVDCGIVSAGSIAQAKQILSSSQVEVLVTDVHLPDGDGISLLPTLRQHQPNASAIVITGAPSLDGAIGAIRGGALDFVPKPFSTEQLVDRVRKALDRHAELAKRDKRFDRLREAVKRLNEARRVISKKVDLLCNDLVSAYGDLSKQLDNVRTQEGFRKYVEKAKDLEQLLCHSMDWLLRQIGYANVAVFLASDEGEFQLGAYMKYTVAGDSMLTNALKRTLLPLAVKEGMFRTRGESLGDKLTPQELHYLKGQDVMAVNCTYLGEALAGIIFFRDERAPFTDEDESLLKQVSPIFAVTLATIVRDGEGGDSPFHDGEEGNVQEPDDKPKPKKRKDPADWWKNGEAPPF
jgi:FixJ family two-component response regulator